MFVLLALVAAAVVQSAGSWLDDSWSVVLLTLALLIVGIASRRLLLSVIVATATVVCATAILAPSLATTLHGDPDLTGQLHELAETGALRGFQDLAVSEVDLSATEPVREAAIGSLTASSPMEIGSITKALTGLVVADAVRRGELSLSAPVATYLPELAGSPAGTVTMRELITHHGGIPAVRCRGNAQGRPQRTNRRVVPHRQPGGDAGGGPGCFPDNSRQLRVLQPRGRRCRAGRRGCG